MADTPRGAFAWNDKAHLVVAYLAYGRLGDEVRARVDKLLQSHPHYQSYLTQDKPEAIELNCWVFMRAATWADFTKNKDLQGDFYRQKWHYINLPLVFPADEEFVKASEVQAKGPNILTALDECQDVAMERTSSDARKSIAVAWLAHLVADIHQPLHCVCLYSRELPTGDLGGNLLAVRDGEQITRLHAFWDNVLGEDKGSTQIKSLAEEVNNELSKAQTPTNCDLPFKDWAAEGISLAKEKVYLNGQLPRVRWDAHSKGLIPPADIPLITEEYRHEARKVSKHLLGASAERLTKVLTTALSVDPGR